MDQHSQPQQGFSAPEAGWYKNSDGALQWWDGAKWGPTAPTQNRTESTAKEDEQYRWVPMGSLASSSDDGALMARIEKAIERIPSVRFSSDQIPQPGQKVPADCAWAFIAYPGPLPQAAFRGSKINKKFVSIGNLSGRTFQELIAAVGGPTLTMALPNGGSSSAWQEGGFLSMWQISLTFDPYGVCIGVGSELAL